MFKISDTLDILNYNQGTFISDDYDRFIGISGKVVSIHNNKYLLQLKEERTWVEEKYLRYNKEFIRNKKLKELLRF